MSIRNINSINEKIFEMIFSVVMVNASVNSKKFLRKFNKQMIIKKLSASVRYFFFMRISTDGISGRKTDRKERKSRNMLPVLGMVYKYDRTTGFHRELVGTVFFKRINNN